MLWVIRTFDVSVSRMHVKDKMSFMTFPSAGHIDVYPKVWTVEGYGSGYIFNKQMFSILYLFRDIGSQTLQQQTKS